MAWGVYILDGQIDWCECPVTMCYKCLLYIVRPTTVCIVRVCLNLIIQNIVCPLDLRRPCHEIEYPRG